MMKTPYGGSNTTMNMTDRKKFPKRKNLFRFSLDFSKMSVIVENGGVEVLR